MIIELKATKKETTFFNLRSPDSYANHHVWRVLGLEAHTLSRNEAPCMRCGLPHGTKPQRVLAEGVIKVVDHLFCGCVGHGDVFDSVLPEQPLVDGMIHTLLRATSSSNYRMN